MSNTIDQRVLEMRFDNKHFESNVSTTLSTLDKLKQKLNLTGATKGLNDISASAKGINLNPLGSAVETVTAKFSALQVMGVTALANITNSAVNAGKNIIKSLTIDPIMSGFSEYETKMGSIQTILANTEHQGTTMNDVTRALDELNLYADKTIYNFQEMTRNIGTFTAAGVDLDTSVRSIQGIANLAAVSGSTSQQASTAMYQLSQALATGTVKLMDWNSVVNAGMGGKVFQNALIQTAAMLDKSADNVEAWKKKNIDAFGSFRDSLTQGEWLTGEVLTKTLQQFTMAAEEGSKEWEEFKKSLMDDGYTEAQAESILKMANTATDAATKVKTFTQLMDTLKESAQSGWAQTWETIIGDFEEAKSFFTELSDIFGGIIGESADRRNTLITETMSSGWDKLITKINDAGVETEEFEASIEKVVGEKKLKGLIDEYGSIEEAARKGAISSDLLKKALDGIGGTTAETKISGFVDGLKEIERTLRRGHVGEDVKKLQTALDSLGYDLGKPGIDGIIGPITEEAIKAFQEANGIIADGVVGPETLAALEKAGTKVEELGGNVDDLKMSCGELIDEITKKSGRELLLDSLLNVIKAIHRPLAAVSEAFRNTFSVSPDQLYNALEGLNKFTSKFVPRGILDATTWTNLTDGIKQLGIDVDAFEGKLKETLKSNGVDVDYIIKKYGSLGEAFNKGAISIDHIKETLLSFDGVTESLLEGGETADKVRRAFEGLFAIFEIAGRIAGGGFKIAFEILSAVLGQFDMNVLDLAASLGDALVAFRDWITEGNLIAQAVDSIIAKIPGAIAIIKDWYNAFKETPAVQELVDAIEAIRSAFDELTSGKIDISEFATSLGTNLANALKSLPGIAVQIASDFIAGFIDGLGSSISGVITNIVEFCTNFVSAFAAALGVQSPSWKAYDIAVDFFQGFINGIGAIFGTVKKVLTTVGEALVKVFKDLWDSITDESGNIQWGKIVAGGIIVSVLWLLKQFATAFNGIAEAFGGFGDIMENIADAVKSFKKVLNAYAWDIKAKALQKLAIAVAILVASVWVLAQIDDIGKLWNAVTVIFALSLILIGLSVAMNQMEQASVDLDGKKLKIEGLKTGLMQIGIVLLLLAAAVKLMGSMSLADAAQGFVLLAGIAVGLGFFMKAMSKIATDSKNLDKLGGMMIKISFAMMLLVGVLKMVDSMSAEEVLGGVAFAAAFALFIKTLTLATKGTDGNVDKIGGMMVKLAIAMGLMVGVVKLASKLTAEEMLQGAAFAAGFTLFVWALVKCTKIANEQKLAKIGGLVLSVSFSLTLLVGVCKLVSNLSAGEMVKGAIFAAGFAVFLGALVKILTIGNEQKIAKVTGTILGLSIAIGVMAGVCALLGLLDVASLTKGLIAIGLLSLMMATMVKSLKGAQNAKGAIMMMAIAIGVMAASIVALSFIDPADLMPAMTALGVLMGMFALMTKAGTKAKISFGSTVIMLGVVIALAGVLAILSKLEVGSTIEVAASIGILMLTMAASMQMISKAGVGAEAAMGPMLKMVGILALVAIILGVMSAFDVNPSIETATSLSILLMSLAAVTAVLSLVGAGAPAALGGIAAFAIVIAGVGAIMLALAGLNALFPDLQSWLDTGIDILEKIGSGIGKFVGGFIGGIGEGMMDSLLAMVETFGTIVEKLVDVSNTGANINADGFIGVEKLLDILGSIGLTTVGTTLSDVFTLGGTSMEKFQTDGVAFFEAMKAISDSSAGITINESAMDSVIGVAQKLSDLQSSLEPIGGVIRWFSGRDDLATFGTNVGDFIESMITALGSLVGATINTTALEMIITAAQGLAKLQSSLEPIGGVISWFTGRDDLATFGVNVGMFIVSMKIALGYLEGVSVNTEALGSIITASQELAKLQSSLEPIGGVISWFTGRDDLGTFGINVGMFISSMKTALANLEGAILDEAALKSVITAATDLAALQSHLEPMGGVIRWFTGREDLGTFGTNIGLFADAMGKLKTAMGEDGISEAVVASVTNAGNAIIALQDALPEESWFDGKMDLNQFSGYITKFSEAMSAFATSASEMNTAAIDTSISTAYRIKSLIESLVGLDASGVSSFAGVGVGDGHLVNMGQAIAKYGEEVADLNVEAVSTSVNAAVRLKSLIASLVGLDTSGIENFKVTSIGDAMKSYSDKVSAIDVGTISSSVSVANRLKNLIASLVGLDTSGVSSFKSAIAELGTIALDKIASSFSGAADSIASAMKSIINAMSTGISGGTSQVTGAMDTLIGNVVKSAKSKNDDFKTAGKDLVTKLADGLKANSNSVSDAGENAAGKAVTGAKKKRSAMKEVGKSLAEGLAEGIKSKAASVAREAVAMVEKAITEAKAAADINSPSRVFRKIGHSIPEGFAMGIADFTKMSSKSAVAMVDDAIDNTKNVISHIADSINSDIDVQPTIRPVLDLSDIRAGAGNIRGLLGASSIGVNANLGAISTMMNRRSQNGANDDVVNAIDRLRSKIDKMNNNTYTINGITYDDGSNVSTAVQDLIRYARIERRV